MLSHHSSHHARFVWLVVGSLLFATCSAIVAEAGAPAQVTAAKVKEALPSLESFVHSTMKETGVPGLAIAVVHNDEVVYLKGFGVRQLGKNEKIDADTVFQLASISKPIGSTVLAFLVAAGILRWDDAIIDHDADFRLFDAWVTRQITFRDLLCHRSGLPDQAGDLLEDLGYGRAEILFRLRYQKPDSSFRSHYAYTNFGYTAACVAGAKSGRKSWEDLCAEKLYRPLGMTSTSSRFADYLAAKNRAVLHTRIDGKWIAKYVRDPDAQSPAGGVSSTVRDMARWMRLHLNAGTFDGKQLVSAEALGETHRAQVVSGRAQNPATDHAGLYGLGWNVGYDEGGRVRLSHSGAFDMGAATNVVLCPGEKLGIIVLSNGHPIGIPEAIAATYLDHVFEGKARRPWLKLYAGAFQAMEAKSTDYSKLPAKKLPALPAQAYAGKYQNDYFGTIEVVARENKMELRMGPRLKAYSLTHWNRDVFIYQPTGEMAAGLSGVTFTIGYNRQATSVTIENLNVNGAGSFARVPKSE